MEHGLGFSHFLSQTDALGRVVLAMLLAMSVASWYLIASKSFANVLAGRRAEAFLKQFWAADSLALARPTSSGSGTPTTAASLFS